MTTKIAFAGLCSVLMLAAPAAYAAQTTTQSTTQMPQDSSKRAADHMITQSVAVVQRAKSDAHFADLLKRSKGVVILPNLVKGALVVGGSGGQGVLLAHRDGRWSDPAFISVGSVSIGAQAGAKAGPVLVVLMTDKALDDFTQGNNFSLNANAGLTVVNYSAATQGGFGKDDVVVWSGAAGGFAGASISGSDFTSNRTADASFYGKAMSTNDIIKGNPHQNRATKLREALPS